MTRFEARLQHVSNTLAVGTGLAYAWARYFAQPANAYSTQSAWEPPMRMLHVLGVPLLIYACGYIWHRHVMPMWRKRRVRPLSQAASGGSLLFLFLPMAASGYFLQVAVDDSWRKAWVITHLVTSGAWALGYLSHFLVRRSET